ncbi:MULTISPECIES: ferritin-like domain-containing protein [Chryseobacterium]|uniref:Ferritin-like metal-binding protein YciE n=1 Tax=Chryseobacterium camelliae TaxID=1265445 RepID=A0ABU0TGT4_9FLAO|nr:MULTISPECIES: ferritin-like domain-containing protein [Chryseobacterium]MDT3405931.1 ferritin-like metal-binding protein YciE [Pseudacidovorax intermedius]MDQ1096265.1 ferritin-like metal-binding protein YciE [Chryseobacterium camelliae]MDQ1100202.1 ferritin-like metal-binding protein YciE [Chryseobacterium sp. SORGH_AS_1048]MDR6087547.1 ferritin-like metal-binding protein YciE [Chryseobacterium sp. SORGH_AS_0909]MDR6131921.1 ferritin-like metal-binding protein YciE [Chryseobacterium sp. SO
MATKTTETNTTAGSNSSATASSKKTTQVDNATVNEDKMKSSPLHKFFLSALKDIYFAEHAIIEALEKMQQAATTEELKEAFEDHQLQTQKHVSRLEKIFRLLEETPEKKECEAIKGIIKEGEEIIKSTEEGSMTRDAALIIAAQKVEHYEIATYGGLAQLAITMGHDKVADLLEKTLQEEEDTDYNLTDIAETFINFDAEQED